MRIEIYTDGACSKNGKDDAPGGWAYYMRAMVSRGGTKKILSEKQDFGSKRGTTNNEMELMAVLEALKAIKPNFAGKANIHVYSDSKYVIGCLNDWVFNWKRNNWKTADGQPVKNRELIEELDELCEYFRAGKPKGEHLSFHWVRGHAGHPINTRVDELAVKAKETLIGVYDIKGSEEDYAALNARFNSGNA